MIYIHGGWPKTGTTSLQAALARSRELLAAAGVVYPEKWLDGNSHNGLTRMLYDDAGLACATDELSGFLEQQADRDVLLSSESLFFLLREAGHRERLLRLLEVAGASAPVTVVWTLRRADDMVSSLYRHLTIAGVSLPAPAELADEFDPDAYLEGLLQVERLVSAVACVEYGPAGEHNADLLRAFGLPAEAVAAIEGDLRAAPRLNVGLSEKQAATVLNLDELTAEAEQLPEKSALMRAFRRGEIEFDDDRPWQLIDPGAARRLHEKMLRASLRRGFEPYPRFFADAEIPTPARPPAVDPKPDLLAEDDLRRLASAAGA